MLKSDLLRAIQQEIHRHDFSHFVDNPPSVAQGGRGVVVPGLRIPAKPNAVSEGKPNGIPG
jgi:hypothetical protein